MYYYISLLFNFKLIIISVNIKKKVDIINILVCIITIRLCIYDVFQSFVNRNYHQMFTK